LLFELNGPLSDELLRMAGSRLAAMFRQPEWIGRWSERELAVLFLGEPAIAEKRGAEAAAALAGSYALVSGADAAIEVRVRLLEADLVGK
jgi:GGDEF domain-containing protein